MTCASCARHVAVTLTIEPGIVRGRRVPEYRLCVRCYSAPRATGATLTRAAGGKR